MRFKQETERATPCKGPPCAGECGVALAEHQPETTWTLGAREMPFCSPTAPRLDAKGHSTTSENVGVLMPEYRLRTYCDGFNLTEQIWEIDDGGSARQLGVTGDRTWRVEQLATDFAGSNSHKLKLAPGQYFPRMARPYSIRPEASPGSNPDTSPTFRNARGTSSGHLHAMIERLEHICRVVHPCVENFDAYGHEVRNLLILACTEVEAQCKNIMAANGMVKTWGTKAYAKLAPAMKLGEYQVTLNWYPWLDPIAPFLGWEPGEMSTQSLPWYRAYNQVKHDRETCFPMATLQNALFAVIGSFVMLCAQYGWDFALRDKEGERAFFQLTGAPTWPAEEIYVLGELKPVLYFSGATQDEIPSHDEPN